MLRPGGAVAVQGGSFFWFKGVFNTVYHQLNKVFPMVRNTSITDRNQYDALVCLIFAFVILFLYKKMKMNRTQWKGFVVR